MSDLISRSALMADIIKRFRCKPYIEVGNKCEYVHDILDEQPTIEAVSVIHGKWIPHKRMAISPLVMNYMCSVCGKDNNQTKFCPECGAKMEE